MRKRNKTTVGKNVVIREREAKREVSLDTEREKIRRKARRRAVFAGMVTTLMVGAIIGVVMMGIRELMKTIMDEGDVATVQEEFVPSVEILDENGTSTISVRTKEYVGMLEADLKDLGIKMVRATLPIGRMREIDINVEGVAPYFKVNIDRGTGVAAEDISKMVQYLEDNSLLSEVTYVDVRTEGKAYYK